MLRDAPRSIAGTGFDETTRIVSSDVSRFRPEMGRRPDFRNPDVFMRGVMDFVTMKTRVSSNTLLSELVEDQHSWNRYLLSAHQHLQYKESVEELRIDDKGIEQACRGIAAEHVMVKHIKDFLTFFASKEDICLPEWDGDEPAIEMGPEDYYLPFFPHNVILLHKDDPDTFSSMGECDASIFVNNDTLFLVDVTTSYKYFEKKVLTNEPTQRIFLDMRDRLRRLFSATNGDAGFDTVSKVHVICSPRVSTDLRPVLPNDPHAELALLLPIFDAIDTCARETIRQLHEKGCIEKSNHYWNIAPTFHQS